MRIMSTVSLLAIPAGSCAKRWPNALQYAWLTPTRPVHAKTKAQDALDIPTHSRSLLSIWGSLSL